MQDGCTTWWFLVRSCSAWWVVKFGRILRVFKLLRFMDEARALGAALKASARRISVIIAIFTGIVTVQGLRRAGVRADRQILNCDQCGQPNHRAKARYCNRCGTQLPPSRL